MNASFGPRTWLVGMILQRILPDNNPIDLATVDAYADAAVRLADATLDRMSQGQKLGDRD